MDYRTIRLAGKQLLQTAAMAAGGSLAIAWLFYNSFWPLVFSPLVFYLLMKLQIKKALEARRQVLLRQFLDMLGSLSAALLAGFSMENALLEAHGEMQLLHGGDSYICRELRTMSQGIRVNEPIEKLFLQFAGRSGCGEIEEFAQVFSIAKKSSGGIASILETTAGRMKDRYDTEKEILVAVSSRKMEQKVMNCIPILILLYLKAADPGYLDVLYGNLFGIIFMTACLGVYGAALYLAQKLADIRV